MLGATVRAARRHLRANEFGLRLQQRRMRCAEFLFEERLARQFVFENHIEVIDHLDAFCRSDTREAYTVSVLRSTLRSARGAERRFNCIQPCSPLHEGSGRCASPRIRERQ